MKLRGFLDEMEALYGAMDRSYADAASQYGFSCEGCADNCCQTHFYHHTIAEYLYLLTGFSTLDSKCRRDILRRSEEMIGAETKNRYLCPLNVCGACILYPYRTLICRLHGLPYRVTMPDGRLHIGPGCAKFETERIRSGMSLRQIDRTPFYAILAGIEARVRERIVFPRRFHMTIAEMLCDQELFARTTLS